MFTWNEWNASLGATQGFGIASETRDTAIQSAQQFSSV